MDLMEETDGLTVVEEALARLAILEDVGDGDLTAGVVPEGSRARAALRAKGEGVASGIGAAKAVYAAVDSAIEVKIVRGPGEWFGEGDVLMEARGPARALLTAERSALNFLQHLSGVATATARFVRAVEGTGVRITDTRKTVPGMRLLEKQAVVDGGGVNHRLGLYDAVMIKDNHVDACGSIAAAVDAARAAAPGLPIVVEARTMAEAEEAARRGVGRILLDNMTPGAIDACVAAIRAIEASLPPAETEGRWIVETWREGDPIIQIEVSGGIALETARDFARPGVDFLAVGAITHSARAVDISCDIVLE